MPPIAVAVGLVPLLAAIAAGPAFARDASVFLVRDVAVDASAENATHARDIALAEGHAVAFRRLIERIVPEAAVGTVPPLEAGGIAPLVQSFEVDGEKTSRVRYLARLTFQFDRAAVRRFLHSRGVRFAVTRAKPRLVLPVLRMAGVYLLWDRPNPWREAWAGLSEADGLVPLAIPSGDLRDLRDISARQAVSGDSARLRAIAERYGAGSVAVMVATPGRGGPFASRDKRFDCHPRHPRWRTARGRDLSGRSCGDGRPPVPIRGFARRRAHSGGLEIEQPAVLRPWGADRGNGTRLGAGRVGRDLPRSLGHALHA